MAQHASIARPAEGSLIAAWAADPRGTLQMTGAEAPLAKEEQDLLDGVHRFAAEVMRPIGERLDRMTPEEVIGTDSPLWQVFVIVPGVCRQRCILQSPCMRLWSSI